MLRFNPFKIINDNSNYYVLSSFIFINNFMKYEYDNE